MNYCEMLISIREDRDLSQQTIANALHISRSTYAGYETGYRRIPLESMIELAKYYNLSLDYLCGLIDQEKPLYEPGSPKK